MSIHQREKISTAYRLVIACPAKAEKEIFTHLLESRKEIEAFLFSSETSSVEKKNDKPPTKKTCPALAGSTTQRIAK
jgi:hypothetical protein